jgi:phosphoserine phosphatase
VDNPVDNSAADRPDTRVLVTITGPDSPGITAALTAVLAANQTALLDVEQVVVHGQLTLCLLLAIDPTPAHGEPVLKDLLFTAKRMGLELQFQLLENEPSAPPERTRFAVTAIGDRVSAADLHAVASVLAGHRANIEGIRQLSDGHLASVEIMISLATEAADAARALRRAILEATAGRTLDIAVQRETLTRRSKRLVVMDMDSTLIRIEVIDELARMHGVVDRVAAITRRAMAGELDFEHSLRERVALLAGLPHERVLALARNLPLTEGAEQMLKVLGTLGYRTAVISGGFTCAANALKQQLNLDYAHANELEVEGGLLTGRVVPPVLGPQRKAELLESIARREGIALEQTIAIGDGANDLAMLERAGLGIAFHAKPTLKAAADTALSAGGLDRILYLLGLHARDVNEILQLPG